MTMIAPGFVATQIDEKRLFRNEKTFSNNQKVAVPVEDAARRIVEGIAKGVRDIHFEIDTTLKGHLVPYLVPFVSLFPDFKDHLSLSMAKKSGKAKRRS